MGKLNSIESAMRFAVLVVLIVAAAGSLSEHDPWFDSDTDGYDSQAKKATEALTSESMELAASSYDEPKKESAERKKEEKLVEKKKEEAEEKKEKEEEKKAQEAESKRADKVLAEAKKRA